MFGLMKINTSNIVPVCLEAQNLITIVLRSFLTHISSVLDQHPDPYYIDSGLVNLLFIEILSNDTKNADSDTIFVLRRLSICQRAVVNQLISKLFKYKTVDQTSLLADFTSRSIDFYIKWFENFICDSHYTQTKPKYDDFQRLFDGWLQHIKQNPASLFDSILQTIDQLLSKLPQPSMSDERMKYIV
ncbi:unnamed protein product [Didymodactylos carnosus]|uniref:Uncharacterized protein n=1 Tax=Didymodactylos carnosus TaxID=1234261 RepID=A0A814E664_9BILA|nr:unnamed protein product [Didymodactylos carnosus]CAF3738559.1 unnamed protein product [Didymodactylos carnosus]